MKANDWVFGQEALNKTIEKSQNPEEERLFRVQTVSFIFSVCENFSLPLDVPYLGSLYFQRYFALRSVLDYNLTAFGLSAVLIGIKVIGLYEKRYEVSELASRGYRLRLGPKFNESDIEKYSKDILAYEFDILKYLKFDLYTKSPLSLIKDIAIRNKDIQGRDMKCTHERCPREKCLIMKKATEYVTNACYSNVFVMFHTNEVAAACYFLAKKAVKMPCALEELGEDPALTKRICVCILTDTSKAIECMKTISTAKT